MASLPYMQLWVSDYLAKTLHLDATESGAYLHLIMNYWQTEAPLVDCDKRLARIAKCSDQQWSNIRETIVEYFEIKDGFLHHNRVEIELGLAFKKSKNASKAGKISAQKRKEKQGLINSRSTKSQRTFNHKDKDKDKETTTKKSTKKRKIFKPPTIPEISEYCLERNNQVDPERFFAHYTSNGWVVGKTKMKCWKSAIITWEKNNYSSNIQTPKASTVHQQVIQEQDKLFKMVREDDENEKLKQKGRVQITDQT